MNYKDIIAGLEDGSITILNNNHSASGLIINNLQSKLQFWQRMEEEYRDKLANKEDESDVTMHTFYNNYINGDIVFGRRLEEDGHNQCWHCGETIYYVPLSETEIIIVDAEQYWNIVKSSKEQYDYIFTRESIPTCPCSHLLDGKKLVSRIEVPTGKLVFQNFFRTDALREMPKSEKYNSIQGILGRNELMQYLASQNVGYGQLTNTSVDVYSNEKDEIIIAHCWYTHLYLDEKEYLEENPEEMTEENKRDIIEGDKLTKYFDDNNLKKIGEISCDVWRWMCADQSVLDSHNELEEKRLPRVIANVQPGTWEIEHYYDFYSEDDNCFLCSKLKLV